MGQLSRARSTSRDIFFGGQSKAVRAKTAKTLECMTVIFPTKENFRLK